MKKLGFFMLAMLAISCQEKAVVDYAIISGNITNHVGELTINSADRSIKEVINVAEDGSFTDTLRFKTDTYILFDGKNRASVYIDTGDSINISYNANDFENSLTFSGIGFEISDYLFSKEKKERELTGNRTGVYELKELEYKAKFNEIKTALTEIITSYEGISEEFKVKEIRNIDYAYLNKISIYERYHAHYAKKPEFKTSEGFLNELESLSYDIEEDFSFSQSYKSMVTSHFNNEATKLAETASIEKDIAFLKVVGAIQNETIKNSLLFDNAKYSVTYTNDLEAFYNEFIKLSTSEDNNKVITESYTKLKTVAKGQPSPQFDNYENFAGGTTSLSDLKGKYVYVDVWATWCGPCIREIPSLKKVEEKYHNKNIEFVSLSIDKLDDHGKWKTMVEEKELEGIQLFADKSWESDFVTGYLIKGIPRFILIDPSGNIVSSNAPRPSQGELIDLFNELNI